MDVSVETKNGVKVQDLGRGIIVLCGVVNPIREQISQLHKNCEYR